MNKGKLIILESGSDASGKQTQTQKLYDRLIKEGHKVKKVTYPNYESPACMPVKMYLEGAFGNKPEDVNAYVASTFYAIDRFASYKTEWETFYKEGGIILSDRYTTSNMVHQAVKMAKNEQAAYLDWLVTLEFVHYGLPQPDKVLFLDVPVKVSQKLMAQRPNKITGEQEKDIHETNYDYLVRCYQNSLEIAMKFGWERINCVENENLKSIEVIHESIYQAVRPLL